jgi:hypothetical protein
VEPDAVLAMAARLLATWPAGARAGTPACSGPRCSHARRSRSGRTAGWRLRRDALVEDGNALDRLARCSLAAAAAAGEPSLAVVVDASPVEVGPGGRFDATGATTVRASSAGTSTEAPRRLVPPLPDQRLLGG